MFLPLMEASCSRRTVTVCETVSGFFCIANIFWKGHLHSCNSSPYKNKKSQMTKSGQSEMQTRVMLNWQNSEIIAARLGANIAQTSRSSTACSSPLVISAGTFHATGLAC